eukprot:2148933-Pleurochrysis_carterae.AAC.7
MLATKRGQRHKRWSKPRSDQQGGVFLCVSAESALRKGNWRSAVIGLERFDVGCEPDGRLSLMQEDRRRCQRSAVCGVLEHVFCA